MEARSDAPGEVSEEVGSRDGRVMLSSLGWKRVDVDQTTDLLLL